MAAVPHRATAAHRIAAWIRRVITTSANPPGADGATLDHGWVIERCRCADRNWDR